MGVKHVSIFAAYFGHPQWVPGLLLFFFGLVSDPNTLDPGFDNKAAHDHGSKQDLRQHQQQHQHHPRHEHSHTLPHFQDKDQDQDHEQHPNIVIIIVVINNIIISIASSQSSSSSSVSFEHLRFRIFVITRIHVNRLAAVNCAGQQSSSPSQSSQSSSSSSSVS